MLKVSTVTYETSVRDSEVPTPKCVKNEIRDFKTATSITE